MENNPSYRTLKREILAYEQKLVLCDEAIVECENSLHAVEKEIEEQFALLLNALAARKAALLQDVTLRANSQKMGVEENRGKIKASVEALKRILSAGEATYTISESTAETVWKSVTNMPALHINKEGITVTFSSQLLEAVRSHGGVGNNIRFSQAGNEIIAPLLGDNKQFLHAGAVTRFAGSIQGHEDGVGLNTKFSRLWGLELNTMDGCLYAADLGHSIRKINLGSQQVSTYASTSNHCMHSFIFDHVFEKCMFATNQSTFGVTKFMANGTRCEIAGSGHKGNIDGIGNVAKFSNPIAITMDPQTRNLYVCDQENHSIRKISLTGEVSTLAGSQAGFADGKGKSAKFQNPTAICYAEQSLLVCDTDNNKIRRVLFDGEVTTVCEIPRPRGIAVCKSNTFFVSSAEHKIYQVIPTGAQKYNIAVLAGNGVAGKKDGKPLESQFNLPTGIAVHEPSHSIFVAEYGNCCIRRISFTN